MTNSIVRLENPPGVPSSTQLDPGQPLHISVTAITSLGFPAPFTSVTVSITDSFPPISQSGTTNLLGNVDFDIVVPNVQSEALLTVRLSFIVGSETIEIPLGIGVQPPSSSWAYKLKKYLPWIILGGVGLIVVLMVMKKKSSPDVIAINPRKLLRRVR